MCVARYRQTHRSLATARLGVAGRQLDQRLLGDGIQSRLLAHALIGKFVYLHYLRARDILSDRKLAEWGLDPDDVLSRRARLDQFQLLLNKLDGWLNGSVFPLSEQALTDIG